MNQLVILRQNSMYVSYSYSISRVIRTYVKVCESQQDFLVGCSNQLPCAVKSTMMTVEDIFCWTEWSMTHVKMPVTESWKIGRGNEWLTVTLKTNYPKSLVALLSERRNKGHSNIRIHYHVRQLQSCFVRIGECIFIAIFFSCSILHILQKFDFNKGRSTAC